MKKLFLAFAACLMALSVSAAAPNIYASGLTAGELADDGTLEITYFLNTAATGLEFQVLNTSGVAVKTYEIAGDGLLTAGAHTTTINLSDCPAGTFTWGIKASAPANETFAEAFTGGVVHSTGRLHAVIDNSPESPYFGRIYGTMRSASNTGSLYAWNADYTSLSSGFMAGQTLWKSVHRLSVDPEGYVWISDYGDTPHSGVYVMDPATLTATPFFNGTQDATEGIWSNADGVEMGASSSGCFVYSSGANAKLFMANEDKGTTLVKNGYCVYNIGQADGTIVRTWDKAPSQVVTCKDNDGGNFAIVGTSHGAWMSQNRAADGAGARSLQFYDNNGTRRYVSDDSDEIKTSLGGGLAVSADEKQLALLGDAKTILLYDITWTGDVPTLKLNTKYTCNYNSSGSLHFDYAGNLVATPGANYATGTPNQRLVIFALPKADNSCLTPAQAKYGFEIKAEAGVVSAESITINEGAGAELEKTETLQLTANVLPAETTNKTILWASNAEDIATVDQTGKVTAIAPGEATITAAIDAVATTFKVTVKNPVVTIIESSQELAKGATLQLHATLTPADNAATILWSSNKTHVATVSDNGSVTAVGYGEAIITAKTADSKEATVTITVPAVPLAAGIYTIGGEGADYASLYDACADVNACGIAGDITLAIAADLTEPKNIGLINTTEHTITIAPASAEKRTITFNRPGDDNSGPSGSFILGINTGLAWTDMTPSQNFVIDGSFEGSDDRYLEFALANTGGGQLCVLGGVKNVEIKNISVINTRVSSTAHAINIRERANTAASNVLIENCYLESKTSSGTCTALNFQLSTENGIVYAKDVVVRNCELVATNRGIFMNANENLTVEGCTFRIHGKAGYVTEAIYGVAGRGSHIIRGNKFLECTTLAATDDYGFYGIVASGGGTWLIENNYFAGLDILAANKAIMAQYVRTDNPCVVRHNTFYLPTLSKKATTALLSATPIACLYLAAGGQTVENNLFVSAETTNINSLIRGSLAGTEDKPNTVKNNVFYHAGGNAYIVGASPAYQDWAAYSTGLLAIQPAKWAQPEFTDAAAGDLSLTGSSNGDVRFAVPQIAAVKTDINGTTRHTGAVYAGAWEGGDFKGLIVDSNTDLSDLAYSGVDLSANDIIVTNKATLTCDIDETAANVRVEDGATLVVNDAKTLAITGTFTAHSQDDVQPQILTKGTGAITYDTFQFLKCIPSTRYYFFSLPFECEASSVTVDGGQPAVYNTDWNIRYYDGAGFAANPSNKSFWLVDGIGTIKPNQGYTIGVATAHPGQYRELAFSTSGAVDFSLNASKTIAVAANGATGTEGEKYKGWSFIMNPYTSNINGTNDNLVISSNAVAYVTIPDPGQNKTYTSKRFSSAGDLPPFFGFFVQVAKAGDVVFNPGTPNEKKEAPVRRANGAEITAEPLLVGVRLSNGVKEDETTLVIGEQFTEAYEIGSDLMKMIGYADKPQLYTFDTETKYAFHSLNETAATQVHPLGVYLPAESEYTFSLMPIEGEREVQAVYLYDYETNACVDLMQEDYTFTSGTLNSEKRFALSPMLAPKATTAIDSNTATDLTVWQSDALEVCVEGAAAGDRVRVFDIQGRLVSEWIATETSSVGNVPASGMYVVECTGATGVQVVKLMINH